MRRVWRLVRAYPPRPRMQLALAGLGGLALTTVFVAQADNGAPASDNAEDLFARRFHAVHGDAARARLTFQEFCVALLPEYLQGDARAKLLQRPVNKFAPALRELSARDGTVDLPQVTTHTHAYTHTHTSVRDRN